ncbi:MAG: hypothetical protein IJV97_05270 [Alphaproteobacteria bacterium]|nr:hypothetical protein [Alphaproteobacteria bacterium]
MKQSNSRRKIATVSDDVLDNALTSGDLDFIVRYLQSGGNVNRLMKVMKPGMSEGIAYNYEVECFPLDRVTDETIRDFLIKNGAVTYNEYRNKIIENVTKALLK